MTEEKEREKIITGSEPDLHIQETAVNKKKKNKSKKKKQRQKQDLLILLSMLITMSVFSTGYYWILKGQMSAKKTTEPEETSEPVFAVQPDKNAKLEENWDTTYRVMAHALGGIEDYDYTNCREAFMANYAAGTRLFETDFEITSDGKICLTHTWEDFCEKLTNQDYAVLSADEFKTSKIHGKYTPLLFSDLLQLMEEYPDFYVIIDSKRFDIEGTRTIYDLMLEEINAVNPNLIHRFIPQAYTPEIYDTLDQEYDFEKIIFTLYHYYVDSDGEKIYQFVKSRKVPVVVMHMDNEWAEKVITDIHAYAQMDKIDNQFSIYIHTVNDMNKALKIIEDYGFFGVYSDFISEDQMIKALK